MLFRQCPSLSCPLEYYIALKPSTCRAHRTAQVSRRLARRLNADSRSGKLGYVQLVAEAYLSLLKGICPEDTALFAKELVMQRVVSIH